MRMYYVLFYRHYVGGSQGRSKSVAASNLLLIEREQLLFEERSSSLMQSMIYWDSRKIMTPDLKGCLTPHLKRFEPSLDVL